MKEIWKDIQGYEGLYQVSTMGNVKRIVGYQCKTERVLKPQADKDGYLCVKLHKHHTQLKNVKVHRLVANAFIENIDHKTSVNHINCDKSDNRVENLEWATDTEQMAHASMMGRLYFSDNQRKNIQAALNKPVECLDKRGNSIKTFHSIKDAAEYTGTNRTCISACLHNKRHTAGGYAWKFKEKGGG